MIHPATRAASGRRPAAPPRRRPAPPLPRLSAAPHCPPAPLLLPPPAALLSSMTRPRGPPAPPLPPARHLAALRLARSGGYAPLQRRSVLGRPRDGVRARAPSTAQWRGCIFCIRGQSTAHWRGCIFWFVCIRGQSTAHWRGCIFWFVCGTHKRCPDRIRTVDGPLARPGRRQHVRGGVGP